MIELRVLRFVMGRAFGKRRPALFV